MSPREPAERQLERVLLLVPLAAREGGASLTELAAALDVAEEQVLRDIEEVTGRAYYQTGDWDADFTISLLPERVEVWSAGEFRRPVALSPRESFALTLGLRLLADGADAERGEALRALAHRLDGELAALPAGALSACFELDVGDATGDGLLALLRAAASERVRVRLSYLKSGAAEPEARTLCPYTLAFASGHWYALGWCDESGGIRAFRLDRMLQAALDDGTYEVPADFDSDAWVDGDVLFRGGDEVEAVVRYAPRITRWIMEWAVEGEPQPDGAVLVRHRVADPRWLARHVLAHGRDAEVVEPPALRQWVAETVERMSVGAA
ncbi:MAG: helix-turn-helix transcriptional regulator [Gemmatimonadota bacterium]